jgi:hypothetical protein
MWRIMCKRWLGYRFPLIIVIFTVGTLPVGCTRNDSGTSRARNVNVNNDSSMNYSSSVFCWYASDAERGLAGFFVYDSTVGSVPVCPGRVYPSIDELGKALRLNNVTGKVSVIIGLFAGSIPDGGRFFARNLSPTEMNTLEEISGIKVSDSLAEMWRAMPPE